MTTPQRPQRRRGDAHPVAQCESRPGPVRAGTTATRVRDGARGHGVAYGAARGHRLHSVHELAVAQVRAPQVVYRSKRSRRLANVGPRLNVTGDAVPPRGVICGGRCRPPLASTALFFCPAGGGLCRIGGGRSHRWCPSGGRCGKPVGSWSAVARGRSRGGRNQAMRDDIAGLGFGTPGSIVPARVAHVPYGSRPALVTRRSRHPAHGHGAQAPTPASRPPTSGP